MHGKTFGNELRIPSTGKASVESCRYQVPKQPRYGRFLTFGAWECNIHIHRIEGLDEKHRGFRSDNYIGGATAEEHFPTSHRRVTFTSVSNGYAAVSLIGAHWGLGLMR